MVCFTTSSSRTKFMELNIFVNQSINICTSWVIFISNRISWNSKDFFFVFFKDNCIYIVVKIIKRKILASSGHLYAILNYLKCLPEKNPTSIHSCIMHCECHLSKTRTLLLQRPNKPRIEAYKFKLHPCTAVCRNHTLSLLHDMPPSVHPEQSRFPSRRPEGVDVTCRGRAGQPSSCFESPWRDVCRVVQRSADCQLWGERISMYGPVLVISTLF